MMVRLLSYVFCAIIFTRKVFNVLTLDTSPKNDNLPELWNWLDSLKNINSVTFCSNEQSKDNNEIVVRSVKKPLTGPRQCDDNSNARLRLKSQKTAIVQQIEKNTISSKTPAKSCYSILPQIHKISGKFSNATFHGKATLFYNDETRMKAAYSKGVINGLVLIIDKHENLQVSKNVSNSTERPEP